MIRVVPALFRVLWVLLGLGVCLAGCGSEPEGPFPSYAADLPPVVWNDAENSVTAWVGATLIDGTGVQPVRDATVLVQGRRIMAAGAEVPIPEGAEVIDASGQWIVPGLIDAHMHFMTSGSMYTRPAFMDLTHIVPYMDEMQSIEDNLGHTLRAFMCSGVTSVLSLGGPSLEYRARNLALSRRDTPSVFIGHGVLFSVPEWMASLAFDPWNGEYVIKTVDSEEKGREIVRDAVAMDADLIKTAVDDRDSAAMRFAMNLTDWEAGMAAVLDEAHQHGLRVTTHAHHLEYARAMVEMGVASLQHIPADQPVDAAFIDLLLANDVVVVPTLAIGQRTFFELYDKSTLAIEPVEEQCGVPGILESFQEIPPPRSDEQTAYWAARRDMARANARTLFDAGVPLGVAADAGMIGLMPGPSLHLELRDLSAVGIPNDALIVAATMNSARVAGKEADYGSIEAGKFADFLVLDADPLTDIGNLQRIASVVKFGVGWPRDAFLPDSGTKW